MQYAPIVLFTYSRTDHTRQAVESLLKNEEAKDSDLFIFSDGPKTEDKRAAVEECRKYLHTISGFKSINIVEREKNWGLANSLIAGITEVVEKYGRVIVVEDDIILSPYFLKFMNEGLEKYKDEDKVGTISAFLPPLECVLPETFFLEYFQCWGWATWKRAWDLFEFDSRKLLKKIRFRKTKFNVGGGVGNYENLYCQKVGLVDSWYLRYYASLFLKNKLSFYPGRPMAVNIGLDGSGSHCDCNMTKKYGNSVSCQMINVENIPIEENLDIYKCFASYYLADSQKTFESEFLRLKSFIRRLLYIDSF